MSAGLRVRIWRDCTDRFRLAPNQRLQALAPENHAVSGRFLRSDA